MSLNPQQREELAELLDALCEERLTGESAARLERLVLDDPDARWFYLTYLDLHGTLYWDTAVSPDSSVVRGPLSVVSASDTAEISIASSQPITDNEHRIFADPIRGKRARVAAVALCVCVLLLVTFLATREFDQPPGGQPIAKQVPENLDGPANPPRRRFEGPAPVLPLSSHSTARPTTPAVTVTKEDSPAPIAADSPSVSVIAVINEQIRKGWQASGLEPSPVADDSEWVRRVYLDLVGHIPPVEVVERFLADRNPRKRTVLIDRLLEDPAYVRHWATVWSNLLVGRSMRRDVDREALRKFLRLSFAENRPWSEIVAELISAEGKSHENGATNFLLAHLNNEAVPATAITAKLFLGIQVHCTQCHKHPFNDWTQDQFWTLHSFFEQTEPVVHRQRDERTGLPKRAFEELVTKEVGGPTYYETRTGLMKATFPQFEGTEIDPGPQINRRVELARLMTSGDKPQIAEAFVNRMWGHFFGYGFTRPVDDMGPHNPPSHPELLDRLAREFVRSGYDVKELMRWICNSEPYQLSSGVGEENLADDPLAGDIPRFSRMYIKPMTAEQLYDSLLVATKAQYAGQSDWLAAEEQRQKWLQQFVIAFETEENDEATTFDGTVPQALMMMNGELVQRALSAEAGTYLGELLRSNLSETEKIRQLCLAALSREPTRRELAAVRQLLRERTASRGSPPRQTLTEAFQDVFWAFLNSNEFLLIH